VKHLILLFALSPFAIASNQTFALSWFLDDAGNTGIVSLVRQTDPYTGKIITDLFYSFCVETEAASCLEGKGRIPNSEFLGTIYTDYTRPDVITVNANTDIPGFDNYICVTPNYDTDSCDGGELPATGGTINVTFTRIPAYAEAQVTTDKIRQNGVLTSSITKAVYNFDAVMVGTVLGVTAHPYTKAITGSLILRTNQTKTAQVISRATSRNLLRR
jgi:hypothetical protein